MGRDAPLEVELRDGRLVISIGVETLAKVVEFDPKLEHWNDDLVEPEMPEVADPDAFAGAVAAALKDEEADDGTTRVHRMLDSATAEVIEQGAEGVWMPGWDEPPPREPGVGEEPER